jgi:hypothetical protein
MKQTNKMEQIESYYNAFMNVFKDIKKPSSSSSSDSKKSANVADDRNTILLESSLVEEFTREVIQEYLNTHYPKAPNRSIFKLKRDGWPNPPLDWYDSIGEYIGEIKYTRYVFSHLDESRSLGVGIPEWKIRNLQMACGFRDSPCASFFKFAWFVYCDIRGEVYYISISPKLNKIIDEAFEKGRPIDSKIPYVHYGRLESRADRCDAPPDFTRALFVPSQLWVHMGTIPEIKMLQIKSSAASIAFRALKKQKHK